MTSLKDQQRAFQAYILKDNKAVHSDIKKPTTDCPHQRLQIYHRGYRIRLIEALFDDFPKCAKLLGEQAFEALCLEYIKQNHSTSFSIRWYGQHFAEFIISQKTPQAAIICEMVQLEWALHLALDAKDAPLLTKEALRALPPELWASLQFKFHPSVHHLSFAYPIPSLWKRIHDGHRFSLEETKPNTQDQQFLVWRKGLNTRFQSMSDIQIMLYHCIFNTMNFADICEQLCSTYPQDQVPTILVQHVQLWIEQEILALL